MKTGYQIQGKDNRNALEEDNNQAFNTIEEARAWVDAVLESINDCIEEGEEPATADDLHIAYYENGVQRGTYPAK